MAILSILTGKAHPVLRAKAKGVQKPTKEVLKLIKDMEETLEHVGGLGLAAPQVGQSLRVCLSLINGKLIPLINPTISWRSKETSVAQEGCLSLPGLEVSVTRASFIIVQFLDTKGKDQELHLSDLEARIVQHEVDHLDGILIVDYLPSTLRIPHLPQPKTS